MSTSEPRRFQFTIRDLLFVTGLTFLGLCVVTPFVIRGRYDSFADASQEDQLWGCAIVVSATLVGAVAGLLATSNPKRRLIAVSIAVCAAWAVAVPLGAPLFRSRLGTGGFAAWAACKAFAEAEEIYHRNDHDGDGVLEYAQSLRELYETKPGAGDLLLVDRTMMQAEGSAGQVPPKAGYVFKVLKWQGPHATGGRKSYKPWDPKIRKFSPHMTAGYALVAAPSPYEKGLKTYIINNNGTIFGRDLGPDTAKIVQMMVEFDPDPNQGWTPDE